MAALASFLVVVITLHQMQTSIVADDTGIDGTELILTFMVHRHGDRTPVEDSMSLAQDRELLEQLIEPWGYGQLTSAGMRRGYELGKFIRQRYNELLSDTYNRSEIYIRSTDSTRTKMTVLTAMSAVYPATMDRWSEDINWTPVPYTTVPAKYDFNTAFVNCPTFIDGYHLLMLSPESTKLEKSVLSKLSATFNYNMTGYPARIYGIFDMLVSERSLGVQINEDILEIWDDVEAAAGEAIDTVFGNDKYIALQAGVLLNEFFKVAAEAVAGNDTQKVRVYSAHDFNVYSLMAVSQITPRQGVPGYGAVFALELRRVVKTGQYVVLPVYVNSPGDTEKYLHVDGCGGLLCDLESFFDITSKYLREEDAWRTQCGWTEDFDIDSSNID